MSDKVEYLTFYIVLTDAVKVKQYQAEWPLGVNRAPYNSNVNGTGVPGGAAIEFQAPWRGYTQPTTGAPFTWAPVSGAGTNDGVYPIDVATFTRHTGGFWGIGGTTTRYYWLGQFVLATNPVADTVNDAAVLESLIPNNPPAHWLEGFETPGAFPFNIYGSAGVIVNRDSSRHVGGYGLGLRSPSTSVIIPININGSTATHEWIRLYIRLRRKPNGTVYFLGTQSTLSASVGFVLGITPAGDLIAGTQDNGNVITVQGTIKAGLPVWDGVGSNDCWRRIDCFCIHDTPVPGTVGTPPPSNKMSIFFADGAAALLADGSPSPIGSFTCVLPTGSGGMTGLKLGYVSGPSTTSELGLDIDDCFGRDIPVDVNGVASARTRLMLNGTKIVRLAPQAFGSNHQGASWSGDVAILKQFGQLINALNFNSSVSGALLEALVDDALVVDANPDKIAMNAIQFSVLSRKQSTGANPKLGYLLNAQAPVDSVIAEVNGTFNFFSVLYPGQTTVKGTASSPYADLTPVRLRYTKSSDVAQSQVIQLQAQAELIGTFSAADARPTESGGVAPTFPIFPGNHNAPYPRSIWAKGTLAPPDSPFIVKSGTYVGNGTKQDLTFRAPVHFLYTRPLSGSTAPCIWWSTLVNSHPALQQGARQGFPCEAREDPAFAPTTGVQDTQEQQYLFTITDNNAETNAAGVTYQYIAVCDPGARFMLNTSFGLPQSTTGNVDIDVPLIDPNFLPEFGFFIDDVWTTPTTIALKAKGPGSAAAGLAQPPSAAYTAGLKWVAGKLTAQQALYLALARNFVGASLWRRADGNNDPGQDGVFATGTWIGDGNASRSVSTGKITGKRPIFVIVFGDNGIGAYRDASNTGTTSTALTNLNNPSTGIVSGAPDGFAVGSALNTNAVVFNYFMLLGDATAGNNGFGVNGEYIPVEASSPTTGPWPAGPTDPSLLALQPGEITGTGGTGGTGTGTGGVDAGNDFGTDCVDDTQVVCNLALSNIGITKRIADVVNDKTVYADQCRLYYNTVVAQVLRSFPWPFATRYATLVLVAGTADDPVNPDWQYSYRMPSDAIFARRICSQVDVRRRDDPNPPKFRVGADDTGELIYTDLTADDGDVVLEYTTRVECVALAGDPLFRAAVAWKLGAAIAPGLSRSDKWIAYCEAKFAETIGMAEVKASNEREGEDPRDADWIAGRN